MPQLLDICKFTLLTLLGMGVISGLSFSSSAVASSGLVLSFGSLGATAALVYSAPASPLAQPRNVLGSHLVCSVIGVGVRLAVLGRGLSGDLPAAVALSVALSVAAMALLGVQHPAGGGTAFLAVASADIAQMGWLFVPSIVLGAAILVAVAWLGSAVGRPYPVQWL